MDTVEDAIIELLSEGPLASRYRLVRALPSDEHGPQVLAQERGTERAVVVRALPVDEQFWPVLRERLRQLSGVRHKKVTALVAHGRHERLLYTVHEYCEGRPLNRLLAERGVLAPSTAVPIISQILMGIGDAHLRGLCVGPFDPQQITLHEEEGRALVVKLHAFGMGPVLGRTLAAPASVSGDEPGDFDPPSTDLPDELASDVFSAGALILRLLTGPLPHAAEGRAAVLRARVDAARQAHPPMPRGLADLLYRALDPDPERRPPDANALVEDLIDAVPMSAFRLPRTNEPAPGPRVEASPHASTSTSAMMMFTGRWKDVADRKRDEVGVPAPVAPAVGLEESSVDLLLPPPPAEPPPIAATPLPPPQRRSRGAWWAAAASLLLVGAGAAVALRLAPETPRAPAVAAAVSAPDVMAPVAVGTPTPPPASVPSRMEAIVPADSNVEPPAPEVGTVEIPTPTAGRLLVDGEDYAATPYRGELPAGSHVLRVEIDGHEPWTAEIEVVAGRQHRFEPSWAPVAEAGHRPSRSGRRARSKGRSSRPASPPEPPPSGRSLLGRGKRSSPDRPESSSSALLPRRDH